MNGRIRELRHRVRRVLHPSTFRLKVFVFMLPLLLPVGQNISERAAEADAGQHAIPSPFPAGAMGNPAIGAAVSPAWNRERTHP